MQQKDASASAAGSTLSGALWAMFKASIIIAGATAAAYLDARNNWKIGDTLSREIAMGMAMAALFVAVIPMMLEPKSRWNLLLIPLYAVAAIISVGSAFLSYSDTLGGSLDAAQQVESSTQEAQREIDEARTVLEQLRGKNCAPSPTPACSGALADLQKLESIAENKKKSECRRSKSDECIEATGAYEAAIRRSSDARSRERAEVTLAAAKQDKKDTGAGRKLPRWAKNLGDHIQVKPATVVDWCNNTLVGMLITFTVLAASALGYGLEQFKEGWQKVPSRRSGLADSAIVGLSRVEPKKPRSRKETVIDRMRRDMRNDPKAFVGVTTADLHRKYGVYENPEGETEKIPLSTFKTWYTECKPKPKADKNGLRAVT